MKHSLILIFFALQAVSSNSIFASENGVDNWKTGSAFRSALNNKIKFQSTGTIRDDLAGLSRNASVAILLDRAIDPSEKIPFPTELQPLGKTLDDVATLVDGRAVVIGSFVYLAPNGKALRYQVLRNVQAYQLSRLSAATQAKLSAVSKLDWPYLSNPRDLVTVLASNCGLKVSNPEMIPHDLWPAQSLPRLACWEQLTFLLACMDRSFSIDENAMTLQVIEVPPEQTLTLKFRKSDDRKVAQIISRNELAAIKTVVRGNDLFVRGPLEENLILIGQMQAARKWKTVVKAGSKDVFDLNTNASRGSILATIAKNRDVELKYNPNVVDLLKQKITIKVEQASVEELLEKTLDGTGLRYQLSDSQLLITK